MMRFGGVGWLLRKRLTNSLFHRALVHDELAIAVVIALWRVLKPVQRRFAGQHRAGRATRFKLS
jgi:hypothetical protein